MKQQNKFSSEEQQQQQESAGQTAGQEQGREFAGAEELLRYDAERTRVPDRVAERLQRSVEKLPPPSAPWWKRMFGGSRS